MLTREQARASLNNKAPKVQRNAKAVRAVQHLLALYFRPGKATRDYLTAVEIQAHILQESGNKPELHTLGRALKAAGHLRQSFRRAGTITKGYRLTAYPPAVVVTNAAATCKAVPMQGVKRLKRAGFWLKM